MIGTLLGTTEIVASIAPPLRKQQFKKLLKTLRGRMLLLVVRTTRKTEVGSNLEVRF